MPKPIPPPMASILLKTPTGMSGFDEITGGGLPRGRPSLVCGSAGCGKTLFAMQFLVNGARDMRESGVYVAFEETAEDLAMNVASIGYDIAGLVAKQLMLVEHIHVERSEITETGEFDLDGLFIRLGHAIDEIGAKRVVLDTIEVLFAALPNEGIVRAELSRLFRWLKERGVTAVITAERGQGTLTRYGIEEYVSDCVVMLDHRVTEEISTRRLRIVKYRGSAHATNEFPFLIDEHGFSVLPITSIGLDHGASSQRASTGIPRLDTMFGGKGYFRGSSILISGTAGTGKSSLASWIAASASRRGERCLYFAFEESADQIMRNMRSIGNDLGPLIENGTLRIQAARSSVHGLEMHLMRMIAEIERFKPSLVVLDPISNFIAAGTTTEVKGMLTRLIDLLKASHITGVFTSLTFGGGALEQTETTISSLMDTWILVRMHETDGERNRGLVILKSRGMAHSNQVREFVLNHKGINLVDVYLGAEGVLMGSARVAREAREASMALERKAEESRQRRQLERKREAIEARIRLMRAKLEADLDDGKLDDVEARSRGAAMVAARSQMATMRTADGDGPRPTKPRSRL